MSPLRRVLLLSAVVAIALAVTAKLVAPEPRNDSDVRGPPVANVETSHDSHAGPTEAAETEPVMLPALHVTREEVTIWRQRARIGPYRKQGDRGRNSPGDWERIAENADRFLSDPHEGRWPGPRDNNSRGCVRRDDGNRARDLGYQPPVYPASELRDAAFYALVTEKREYALAGKRELLAQAREDGVDFGDRERWCFGKIGDGSPGFMIANWLTKFLFAMSYLEVYDPEIFNPSERQELMQWFASAAEWMAADTDQFIDELFEDRAAGDYTLTAIATDDLDQRLYYGGPSLHRVHRRYNNRNAAQARYVGLVGIHQGKDEFIDHAKAFVKEALMFSYFSEGVVGEFERWEDDEPNRGWTYATLLAGSLITIADHLARAGDIELYEFTTSEGALGTEGGDKSLLSLVQDLLGYVDGSLERYATDRSRRAGLERFRISSVDHIEEAEYVHDLMLIMANVHYRSPYVRCVYTRRADGVPPYPERPRRGSGNPESGEWGIYPGMLFMFGELEGRVWPYPADRPRGQSGRAGSEQCPSARG